MFKSKIPLIPAFCEDEIKKYLSEYENDKDKGNFVLIIEPENSGNSRFTKKLSGILES